MSNKSNQITPSKIEITNFYISTNNDRSGSIYANGAMQAVVYIHYSYDGEATTNTAVETYIQENIKFYTKGDAPSSDALGGTPLPFNIQEKENNFIHDLNLASTDNETPAVMKIYFTVNDEGDYSNFQPYVKEINLTFTYETVINLNAKAFNVSSGNLDLNRDYNKHISGEDGTSDLWSLKYTAMSADNLKLWKMSGFDKENSKKIPNSDIHSKGSTNYDTETGSDIKGLSGANCIILYAGNDDRKMVLGYAPEYYGLSGHPAPYFAAGSSDKAASAYVDYGYRDGWMEGGNHAYNYPSSHYGETIKDRHEVGKIYFFGVKENNGPYFYTISSSTTIKYRFNNNNGNGDNGAYFILSDNAGNKIRVRFSFHGHWDSDSDYMGIYSASPHSTKQAEVVA